MPSEIPSTPKPYASHAVDSSKSGQKIDSAKLIPLALSAPATLGDFERGIERVKNHYEVHSTTGSIVDGLENGLALSYERGIPLSKTSRAIASALAKALEDKKN